MFQLTAVERVRQGYSASLRDLTFNSKDIINELTDVASREQQHAEVIVQLTEQRLHSVQPPFKLPIMYLMDSILKNVGGVYCDLFTQNIVSGFMRVFEVVDPDTKQRLIRLHQTWEQMKVFPPTKLRAIHERICESLQAHPLPVQPVRLPQPPLLPLPGQPQFPLAPQQPFYPQAAPFPAAANPLPQTLSATHQLLEKLDVNVKLLLTTIQTELPVQYPVGLIAELSQLQLHQSALQRSYEMALLAQDSTNSQSLWLALQQVAVRQEEVAELIRKHIFKVLSPPQSQPQLPPLPAAFNQIQPSTNYALSFLSQQQSQQVQQQPSSLSQPLSQLPLPASQPIISTATPRQPVTNELLDLLLKGGLSSQLGAFQNNSNTTSSAIITPSAGITTAAQENSASVINFEDESTLSLRNEKAINQLYSDKQVQCGQCGKRFSKQTHMQEHLDWHFRMKQRDSDAEKQLRSRNWFLPEQDWLNHLDSDGNDESAAEKFVPFFPDAAASPENQNDELQSCRVEDGESGATCDLCHEKLETFWDEDLEEWKFKGASRRGVKIVHIRCSKSGEHIQHADDQEQSETNKRKVDDSEGEVAKRVKIE